MLPEKIRNFAIIAHIDHGKSTLADRLIGICGGLSVQEMEDQVLDSMPLEKEKGITIKAQTVRLQYCLNESVYQLNLIDTPGHADFAYEVSRSLAACEGSILLVDASQGIQAQTIATVYQAVDHSHEILPVLNKIDLPSANVDSVKKEIEEVIGIDASKAICVSARTGEGIELLLETIIKALPAPKLLGGKEGVLKALIFDSWYDKYLGVIALIRIVSGEIRVGMQIRLISTSACYVVEKLGFFSPKKQFVNTLCAGEIGFLVAKIKQVSECNVGDTIVEAKDQSSVALPGFKRQKPAVFCGMYPLDKSMFAQLKEALEKLRLNDSSLQFEQQTSSALGIGFRCGFLGMLHLEITQERLEREFGMEVVTTAPSVNYMVMLGDGRTIEVRDPDELPDPSHIKAIHEPWVEATIITPTECIGGILQLCADRRGVQISSSISGNRTILVYKIPLNEIVLDFCDRIKALSKGFASLDWEMAEYEASNLVKLNILINGVSADALCTIVHREQAEKKGREICEKLRDLIPRHLFQIAIQAAIGSRVIARETVKALRKNVLSKCYGGDVTRKRKLLEKQKAGKKKMRAVGNVNIPQEVFIEALKM
jgi:GTP-binding protein LepA